MKECALCGKGSILRGARKKLRGHYNPTPLKRKYPNLQWFTPEAGKRRILACVSCIKTHTKKAVRV
ncbi:MAG: hypothetical protein A3H06_00290 [Candidatus Colwellbacteria bacterium RIFCSPLOWO2_12_FULL_44_13]|uniref:50S ribosomal protein L28 n=3 Tax=Candidatus Colwelliibacteriota TaxID=1817904 RepID=A0A1G1Z6M7_9BACT|nr:MAG: hypothetical protein A3F24_02590 [Candidatus Colwellbacteria bacterium RIFCSPHIGHO2_12_FULL_44_17]OGY60283.1 MAG: hypothetical protein A3I31_00350 [Candidatus Colwellbacteria bacterium RIFCSPLOWO2_02_FULL_44_20b]OGY61532.1 MAG: hypothetical protein A3H06_00290 [Candidatus Colwellbacteria bacterium RIFCSPLOWO2_12_FULL_44_13]